MLSGYQGVQLAPDVFGRDGDVPLRAVVAEQDEPELAADDLLVALEPGPGTVAADPDRRGTQDLLHLADVPAGQAERGEEPEGDRAPVREALVACGGLERVRERV